MTTQPRTSNPTHSTARQSTSCTYLNNYWVTSPYPDTLIIGPCNSTRICVCDTHTDAPSKPEGPALRGCRSARTHRKHLRSRRSVYPFSCLHALVCLSCLSLLVTCHPLAGPHKCFVMHYDIFEIVLQVRSIDTGNIARFLQETDKMNTIIASALHSAANPGTNVC